MYSYAGMAWAVTATEKTIKHKRTTMIASYIVCIYKHIGFLSLSLTHSFNGKYKDDSIKHTQRLKSLRNKIQYTIIYSKCIEPLSNLYSHIESTVLQMLFRFLSVLCTTQHLVVCWCEINDRRIPRCVSGQVIAWVCFICIFVYACTSVYLCLVVFVLALVLACTNKQPSWQNIQGKYDKYNNISFSCRRRLYLCLSFSPSQFDELVRLLESVASRRLTSLFCCCCLPACSLACSFVWFFVCIHTLTLSRRSIHTYILILYYIKTKNFYCCCVCEQFSRHSNHLFVFFIVIIPVAECIIYIQFGKLNRKKNHAKIIKFYFVTSHNSILNWIITNYSVH